MAASRLAVIHRNHLFRQCLAVVFGDFEIVEIDHALILRDLLGQLEQEAPDVAIIDLSLPGDLAIEVACHVRECGLATKIVVIVTNETQGRLADYVVAGADAWVHQESSLDELVAAVNDVLIGQTFCSARLLPEIVNQFANVVRTTQWREKSKGASLTQRELEILELVSDRMSNKQIAKQLSISLYTVKNHVHSILEKLDVENRHSAVDFARQQRWLSNPTRTI